MRSPTASRLPGRASARQRPSPVGRDQRRLDGAAGAVGAAAHAVQPCRDHPGVVEDQHVAGLQPVAGSRATVESLMLAGPATSSRDARRGRDRPQRDQFRRQRIVEIVETHGGAFRRAV